MPILAGITLGLDRDMLDLGVLIEGVLAHVLAETR